MATERTEPPDPAPSDAAAVTSALLDALGERLVAVIAGIDNAQTVREWASGARLPSAVTQHRLYYALEVVRLLREREGPATVRAWWIGMNPTLGNRAPALEIARDPAAVKAAARADLAM